MGLLSERKPLIKVINNIQHTATEETTEILDGVTHTVYCVDVTCGMEEDKFSNYDVVLVYITSGSSMKGGREVLVLLPGILNFGRFFNFNTPSYYTYGNLQLMAVHDTSEGVLDTLRITEVESVGWTKGQNTHCMKVVGIKF